MTTSQGLGEARPSANENTFSRAHRKCEAISAEDLICLARIRDIAIATEQRFASPGLVPKADVRHVTHSELTIDAYRDLTRLCQEAITVVLDLSNAQLGNHLDGYHSEVR